MKWDEKVIEIFVAFRQNTSLILSNCVVQTPFNFVPFCIWWALSLSLSLSLSLTHSRPCIWRTLYLSLSLSLSRCLPLNLCLCPWRTLYLSLSLSLFPVLLSFSPPLPFFHLLYMCFSYHPLPLFLSLFLLSPSWLTYFTYFRFAS